MSIQLTIKCTCDVCEKESEFIATREDDIAKDWWYFWVSNGTRRANKEPSIYNTYRILVCDTCYKPKEDSGWIKKIWLRVHKGESK